LVRTVAALPVLLAGYEPDWRGFDDRGRPVFRLAQKLMAANGERSMWLITIARWACIPFSLIGALFSYFWARDLYGNRAGLLALVLWCLSPNIFAHASLMTPDTAATALGVAACYWFWKWLKQPTWMRAFVAGLALGIAELTKMTLVVLYPVWIVIWFAYRVKRRSRGGEVLEGEVGSRRAADENVPKEVMPNVGRNKSSQFRHVPNVTPLPELHKALFRPTGKFLTAAGPTLWRIELVMLGMTIAVSLYVLNLGYGFEDTFKPTGEFEFVSQRFGGTDATQGKQGNRLRDIGLGWLPVPLPANYLRGIDVQQRDFEAFGRQSYLRGKFSEKGWWYYYLYGLTVKVPLGLWVLLIFAVGGRITRCVQGVRGRRESNAKVNWRDEIAVLVPLFAILALVSSQSGFSHHFRYILPIFPFAFIWISQVAEYVSRTSRIVVGFAVVWFVGSSLSVYPHGLSYFNELAGGPRGGHAHMIHSSIDWGQDLLYLKQWADEHPDATPLHLIYCGDFDPQLLGIEFEAPEFTHPPDGSLSTLVLKPGWYAVSVNFLRGYEWRAPIGDGRFVSVPQASCTALLEREPTALAGYSIYIYEISPPGNDIAD
jgi:hypothetical protein